MFMKDFTRTVTAFSVAPRAKVLPAPAALTGLVAGTLLETATGWRGVETLNVGDRVQTLDGGLASILGLHRTQLTEAGHGLLIPGGCLDACSDVFVMPGQHLLLDTIGGDFAGTAPFVLIPASALQDDTIRRCALPQTEVITPLFADEEIVYAQSGLLLHCPGIVDGAGRLPEDSAFPRLEGAEARAFLRHRARALAL